MSGNLLTAAGVFILSLGGGFAALAVRDWWLARQIDRQKPELPKEDLLAVQRWVDWNPWYLQSEVLRLEAQSIHVARALNHPEEPLEDNLAEVSVEMYMRHPEIRPTIKRVARHDG